MKITFVFSVGAGLLLAPLCSAIPAPAGPGTGEAATDAPPDPDGGCLACTPQMGWNNYNAFSNNVQGSTMIEAATAIKKAGLQAAGYHYITMDDMWSTSRDGNGRLQPLKSKFPNGVPAIANQLHSMGFKWGMYSDAGSKTCAKTQPGSEGSETIDATTFASWGVDYLKYDNCNHDGKKALDRYTAMSTALKAANRPIFFAMCNWGEENVWNWGHGVGNSWRMSGDIKPTWSNILSILTKMQSISANGRPGGWNDMDMLEVGNKGLTDAEQVSHFSLWAALKSSLMMGHNPMTASADATSILANPAVIAISQDPLGVPATYKKHKGNGQLWSGPLDNGDFVVVLFNTGGKGDVSATAGEIFAGVGEGAEKLAKQTWALFDLWAGRGKATYDAYKTPYKTGLSQGVESLFGVRTEGVLSAEKGITATVDSHGVVMYRLRPQDGKGGAVTGGNGGTLTGGNAANGTESGDCRVVYEI